MGTSKPLLQWLGSTLVARQVESVLDAGVEIVCVVTGHRGTEVAEAVAKSELVSAATLSKGRRVIMAPNPRYREGKSFSVRAGLETLPPRVTMIVMLGVDQPRPSEIVERVLSSHLQHGKPITSPRYDGHGGHPLVFDASSIRPELEAITEATEGIRDVVRRHSSDINWVPFDDPVVRLDFNTPDDYAAAASDFARRSARL